MILLVEKWEREYSASWNMAVLCGYLLPPSRTTLAICLASIDNQNETLLTRLSTSRFSILSVTNSLFVFYSLLLFFWPEVVARGNQDSAAKVAAPERIISNLAGWLICAAWLGAKWQWQMAVKRERCGKDVCVAIRLEGKVRILGILRENVVGPTFLFTFASFLVSPLFFHCLDVLLRRRRRLFINFDLLHFYMQCVPLTTLLYYFLLFY